MEKPYFVSHCDEPSCDLGSLHYQCPVCKKHGSEYGDAWWQHQRGLSVEGVTMQCAHCKSYLLLHEKDYDVTLEEAKSIVLYIIVIKHNENSFQVHTRNGEIWSSDTAQGARDWGVNVQDEFPEADIQIVKIDGPPGMTLAATKKHMLEELRKILSVGGNHESVE